MGFKVLTFEKTNFTEPNHITVYGTGIYNGTHCVFHYDGMKSTCLVVRVDSHGIEQITIHKNQFWQSTCNCVKLADPLALPDISIITNTRS